MLLIDTPKVISIEKQGGAVLIVGLIMVLLMTIVGLAAIRGSGLQEIMAGNVRDRNVAFQAAEGGLSAAEEYAEDTINLNELPFDGSVPGLIEDSTAEGKVRLAYWTPDDWTASAVEVDFELSGVSEQPRYVLERANVDDYDLKQMLGMSATSSMPINVEFYRITSRGVDGTGNSDAVVQSNYIKLN